MTQRPDGKMDRRSFLRSVGGVSTVAVAAAAATPIITSDAQAYDPGEEHTRALYNPDAPDVQTFYRTNRYETRKK
jgi:hypothetical protein